MTEPHREIQNGVVYYFEGEVGEGSPSRHRGAFELYPNWVRLVGGMGTWIPRERVEQVHES